MTLPALPPGHVVVGQSATSRYSIRTLLGHTGVSATYHAQNGEGHDVALKIYDPGVSQHAAVMKGLEVAAATTNALPQGSAAPILDAGYDQQLAAPYTVTPLLPLPSLRGYGRRMSADEVVALLTGMARSIDLAHLRQVVHGALKPTNIFVGPSCNPVVVTDFAANLPKGAIPTQEGFIASAPWIAPEQAQGGAQVSPAADVFSAGLVVFFALTGRSYWRSCQHDTPDVAAWQQELFAQRTPASARAAEIGVPVSPAIDQVMWKALAQNPDERYRSIGELAGALGDAFRREQPPAATMALPAFPEPPPVQPAPVPAQDNYPPPAPAPQPMPPPPPKASSKALPAIIAAAVVALLGGAAAIWIVRKPAETEVPEDAPVKVEATAATVEPPEPDEPPPPVVEKTRVVIYCVPDCDEIKVDGEALDLTKDLRLPAGNYKIEVAKKGYLSQTEDVVVEEKGGDLEKTFTLKPTPVGTWKPPKDDKPCGQFLKRCD